MEQDKILELKATIQEEMGQYDGFIADINRKIEELKKVKQDSENRRQKLELVLRNIEELEKI